MATYSKSDKFLHRFYLSNYSISKATLEMEEIMYGARAKEWELEQSVFVTGLARSGTTAVMRKIFDSDAYASLQYSNMPFLLCPNLWKRKAKLQAHERAHKDGIIIDGNSPEEFDEYFWKAFLKDSYIADEGLLVHEVEEEVLQKYQSYIKLIALSKGKHRYISKNNNNILRLPAIKALNNSIVIMLIREPLSHAASLIKLHEKFSQSHKEDRFSLEYFNYLGHHEFGLNHKPFLLTSAFEKQRVEYDRTTLDYWLAIWLNYYQYVLEQEADVRLFIRFEDLIDDPDQVYGWLWKELESESPLKPSKKHRPGTYAEMDYNQDLYSRCQDVYKELSGLLRY